jgi:uroporphyrinogen decarboxylase
MNSKQRVLNALRRTALPDRVPLQFDLCQSLLEAFSARYGLPMRLAPSYFEDLSYRISCNELRTAMGSDVVVVGGGLPEGYAHLTTPDGAYVNEFGLKMRQGPLYAEVVEAPLVNVTSADEVSRFPFPDPLADGRFDEARRVIDAYRDDFFIVGDLELTVFALARHMVGMEKLLMDMALGEAYVDALFDRVMAFSAAVGKKLIELGVDAIWTGDDIGGQNAMLISPRMWRRYFKPRYAELIAEFKAANPEVLMVYHSDGVVAPVLDELIEIGVEVFNPVQPNVPGHDSQALKSRFGDRLSFWGAIDQQQLLPQGTPEQIAADVEAKIEILGAGGGYLCSPAHIIQSDVSMANVEAFITAVKEHGVYA